MKPFDRDLSWIMFLHFCSVESLAKLLHGFAASVSVLFGQVAWGELKLPLAPYASACPRKQPTESQAH